MVARSVPSLADCPLRVTSPAALTIGCAVSLKPLQAVGLIIGLGGLYAILSLPAATRSMATMP